MAMTREEKRRDAERIAANVVEVKKHLRNGLTAVEIAEKMKQPESSVRAWINIIETAKANKAKHEAMNK